MSVSGIIQHPEVLKLGESLPPGNPHGVSVHLPTWEDTLGWASRDRRVLDTMVTGYPRFFIPRVVERLAERILEHFAQALSESHGHEDIDTDVDLKGKHALILSTGHHALMCRRLFCQKLFPNSPKANFDILIAHWDGSITAVRENDNLPTRKKEMALGQEDIFLLPYPVEMFPTAKAFWQHTGFGISSRRASYWMESSPFLQLSPNGHRQTNYGNRPSPTPFDEDSNTQALGAIRTRLADCYSTPSLPVANDDVLLYPTGMSCIAAISSAIKSLDLPRLNGRRQPSVALFGFLYVDTLKLLSTLLGFDFKLFPFSTPLSPSPTTRSNPAQSSLSELLESGELQIDLLITEFPGNPLLQSPDLKKLWELSRRYGFALVVDDTVGGTGANVNVLGRCDAVVSSLTKMVSGGCDVMGGCAVLNSFSGRYQELKGSLEGKLDGGLGQSGQGQGGMTGRNGKRDSGYAAKLEGDVSKEEVQNERKEETDRSWFPSDIDTMNNNSRDFIHRVRHASSNANWLVQHLLRPHTSVQEVYYPRGSSTEAIYEQFRVKPTSTSTDHSLGQAEEGGYGFLVSIKFMTPAKARAFYDALDVAKGPSLGTNFTLCCAYTLLAHYRELEWAAEFGVVEDLVRISVGLEEREWLGERVGRALKAAGECRA
ncbi:hypothetical protein SMAC4_09398 [Sordaria macrospora]|uniref:uncharacterized protein n=1 Tax=Sordaria macrospora TaxID=5147 RepID=UPI002B2896F0|nr:hypothetical protein SMAC4_09398 [Sordaria macrospora]